MKEASKPVLYDVDGRVDGEKDGQPGAGRFKRRVVYMLARGGGRLWDA